MVRPHVAIRLRSLEEGYTSGTRSTGHSGLRSFFAFTFTWHYVLVISIIVVPSAVKARAVQKGQAILSNALDVFIGVGVTLGIMLLSALKKRRFSGLLWFFESSCLKQVQKCVSIIALLAFRSRNFIMRALARLFLASTMDIHNTTSSGVELRDHDPEVLQRRFRMRPVRSFRQPSKQHTISRNDEDGISTHSSFHAAENYSGEVREEVHATQGLRHDLPPPTSMSSSSRTFDSGKSGHIVLPPLSSAFAGPYSDSQYYSLPSRTEPSGSEVFSPSFPSAYWSDNGRTSIPAHQETLRRLPPITPREDRWTNAYINSSYPAGLGLNAIGPETTGIHSPTYPSNYEQPYLSNANSNTYYSFHPTIDTRHHSHASHPMHFPQDIHESPHHSSHQEECDTPQHTESHSLSPYARIQYEASDLSPRQPSPILYPSAKRKRQADAAQLKVLNEVYTRTAFPTTEERLELAKKLDMSARSVQIWFQNKRQSTRQSRSSTNVLAPIAIYPNAGASPTSFPIPNAGLFGTEATNRMNLTGHIPLHDPPTPESPKADIDPSVNNADKKQKRTNVTQRKALNETYSRTTFPTMEERVDLAKKLDMSARDVQVWFQNKRASAKHRRRSANPLSSIAPNPSDAHSQPLGSTNKLTIGSENHEEASIDR